MRWPFKNWGATTVLSGHEHVYERLYVDGLSYFVNGLGGESIHSFDSTIFGSQLRYNGNYGAMIILAYDDSLSMRFYNVTGNKIDQYKILPSPKNLSLTSYIEGLYDLSTGNVTGDSVIVSVRNSFPPYSIVDSSMSFLQNMGSGLFTFTKVSNATDYYLVLRHRNSVETWSGSPVRFSADVLNYNFTSTASQAYGNNLILKGTKYCIYSGDVDQNGIIDGVDLSIVDNDAANFTVGYVPSDVTGNNIVDGLDLLIVDNNSYNFVQTIRP